MGKPLPLQRSKHLILINLPSVTNRPRKIRVGNKTWHDSGVCSVCLKRNLSFPGQGGLSQIDAMPPEAGEALPSSRLRLVGRVPRKRRLL